MEVKEELKEALGTWTQKVEDPKIKSHFEGFNKTLQFNFQDQEFNLHMVFSNGCCVLLEGPVIGEPDVTIITDSNIILKIARKEMNPIKAFLSRKLQAKGNRTDMLKIQMLMK